MHEFVNSKTGDKLSCGFVVLSSQDTEVLEGFQRCVCDEYGYTYPYEEIYDIPKLAEKIRDKEVVGILAQTLTGEPVSSIALTPCDGLEGIREMTMHVVRKPYRGYGVGKIITDALLKLPAIKECSAIVAHSVTFHTLAQHQTIKCGFIPTGFLFLVHRNDILKHSFDISGCIKQSFAVSVLPSGKSDAGVLYVPKEHREFINGIYDEMGVTHSFAEETVAEGSTVAKIQRNNRHNTLTAEIYHCGEDFELWLDEVVFKETDEPTQTINLFIDMNDKSAILGYNRLKKRGFIFTGIHPLCRNGEFMIMHNSMQLTVPFYKLCIEDNYKSIYEYICKNADSICHSYE